jgi:NAD(P)H-hydrate repair Nnr-like enzyme with NAD(P)H-hydrate epimerase domain
LPGPHRTTARPPAGSRARARPATAVPAASINVRLAARLLAEAGYAIDLFCLGEASKLTGDAARAAKAWGEHRDPGGVHRLDERAGRTVEVARQAGPEQGVDQSCDLVIDALFGAGLSRDLDGSARALVETVNASGVAARAASPVSFDASPRQKRSMA